MATALSDVATALSCQVIVPVGAYIEPTNGAAADLIGGDGPVVGFLVAGEIEPETLVAVHLEESATGTSGWADIPGAAFPDLSEADSQTVAVVSFARTARYVRAVISVSGEGSAGTFGVLVGHQKKTV